MSRPGFLDRLSAAFGILRGNWNYDSVRPSVARGRLMHSAPADLKTEQTAADQREILRACRYLDKNNAFVAAWKNAHLTYGIGDGLRYQPLTPDPEWNRRAKELIGLRMARVEITGRYNALQFQRMLGGSVLIDGELWLVRTTHLDGTPCVQVIECHRVTQPPQSATEKGWVQGIRFDGQGRPVAVAILEDDGQYSIKPFNQIIQVYEPDRFTGVRGVSKLQVAVNVLRDRAETAAAERLAVKEFSRRTFVLTSESGEFGPGDAGILGRTPPRGNNGSRTSAEDVAQAFGGLALSVRQGEKLEAFEHNRPSLNVLGLLDTLDRDAANALGISSDFLLNPTKIGGAVVRMELAKAERQFSAFQNTIINALEQVCQYFLADAIDKGELPSNPAWYRMTFQTPRRLSVDVGRDTLAMIRALEAGATNLRDIMEEAGKEYESEVISRLDDKVWAMEQAKARGLTYDDVSLTSILSKPAEEAAPASAHSAPAEMEDEEENGVEDEPPSQEEPESQDEDNSR